MKRLWLALLGMCILSVPGLAIQQFQSDTTHEMGIDSNSNIFLRDASTGPVTLNQLANRLGVAATVFQPANVSMSSNTIIPALNVTYETLLSTGTNLILSGLPTISTTTVVGGTVNLPDGTFLVLSSTSTQTFTLQDNGTLSNSLLLLGASTRVIGNHKTIGLILNAGLGKWTELFYANNN